MPLLDQIQKDIIAAMKSREEARLDALRMIKTALKKHEIDSMKPLDEPTELQILNTLIKQRKEASEMFRKGNRPELADKEDAEQKLIESYMPSAPTPEEMRALLFAWKICKHVKSNAIVYARDGQTVGVGAGQMSRVDSAKIGAMKAQLPLRGTVAASDAFFPFPDGVEEIARAGATAIIQPGGSQRDAEVIAAADRLGLAMLFTGVRHFRH